MAWRAQREGESERWVVWGNVNNSFTYVNAMQWRNLCSENQNINNNVMAWTMCTTYVLSLSYTFDKWWWSYQFSLCLLWCMRIRRRIMDEHIVQHSTVERCGIMMACNSEAFTWKYVKSHLHFGQYTTTTTKGSRSLSVAVGMWILDRYTISSSCSVSIHRLK